MEVLSDVKHAAVSEHIKNNLTLGELNGTSVGFSDKSSNGRNKKASGKSREFKLLLKMVERKSTHRNRRIVYAPQVTPQVTLQDTP